MQTKGYKHHPTDWFASVLQLGVWIIGYYHRDLDDFTHGQWSKLSLLDRDTIFWA